MHIKRCQIITNTSKLCIYLCICAPWAPCCVGPKVSAPLRGDMGASSLCAGDKSIANDVSPPHFVIYPVTHIYTPHSHMCTCVVFTYSCVCGGKMELQHAPHHINIHIYNNISCIYPHGEWYWRMCHHTHIYIQSRINPCKYVNAEPKGRQHITT